MTSETSNRPCLKLNRLYEFFIDFVIIIVIVVKQGIKLDKN